MYDTIKFRMLYDLGEKDYLLSNSKNRKISENTGLHWYNINIKNLKITISVRYIIITGSLSKFYFGDNLHALTRETPRLAIKELSGLLHLNIDEADVMRIDVGANFHMQFRPKTYYSFLGEHLSLKRALYNPNTLYYTSGGKNPSRVLAFYDKGKESRQKGINLLRYEARWENNLSQKLKYSAPIKGKTLYKPDFYEFIITCWKDNYFNIRKVCTPILLLNAPINTPLQALKITLGFLWQQQSVEKQTEIQNLLESELKGSQKIYRLRNELKKLSDVPFKYRLFPVTDRIG